MTWFYGEWQHMTADERQKVIDYLETPDKNGIMYHKPVDCYYDVKGECSEYRPACKLGICKIAVILCGKW